IIRQQFPQLTTRRLGTRGQSRYHYYGIAIKEHQLIIKLLIQKSPAKVINSRTRTATMLPQFPNLKDFILPKNLDKDK
ncbi:unnamed protein product, partial [Sphagnum compactum]